jgi:spore coat polysaccharide biosynthesis protein SpsF (cytidylyltransferase family)
VLDDILRATADNPLVDQIKRVPFIDFSLEYYLDLENGSLAKLNGYPAGIGGLQMFSISALKSAADAASSERHREEPDEYIIENPAQFKIKELIAPPEKRAPHLSLTVDTADDFREMNALYQKYLGLHDDEFVSVEWAIAEVTKIQELNINK